MYSINLVYIVCKKLTFNCVFNNTEGKLSVYLILTDYIISFSSVSLLIVDYFDIRQEEVNQQPDLSYTVECFTFELKVNKLFG